MPAVVGLWLALLFNAVMLTSAGTSLDSTFSSTAKFAARDWPGRVGEATHRDVRRGRWAMAFIAVFGNLPLLSLYVKGVGPAVIAATTISGTAVMGLAPIFLLAWLPYAGRLSFHLALWPGVALGVLKAVAVFASFAVFPAALSLGVGPYARDLGINVWGLVVCTGGFVAGTAIDAVRFRSRASALSN